MTPRPAPPTTTELAAPAESSGDARLRGSWLMAARAAWLIVALVAVAIFVAGLQAQYTRLATVCPAARCTSGQLGPAAVRALHGLGLSLGFFATYAIALIVIFAVVYGGIAAIIVWRRPDDRMALFVSLALLTFGLATFTGVANALAEAHPPLWLPVAILNYLGSAAFILFLFLFPSGHFAPRWTRWVALAWNAQQIPATFFPHAAFTTSAAFTAVGILIWATSLATVIYSQVYRYRRVSTLAQRRQTKWVVLGIGAAVAGLLAGIVVLDILDPLPASPSGMAVALAADAFVYGALLLVPLSIAIAMLRSHLFDVDVLIERTLVYGALTASVILLYVVIVGALSVAFQVRANVVISLAATGVIAVAFQPLRERLQLGVNRLVYGQRDEPYAVISRLGRRLEATLAPEEVLPALVETVAQALKLPYVALLLRRGDGEGEDNEEAPAATWGAPSGSLLRLPMVYAAEVVGELVLAPRDPSTPFSPADLRLLPDLARQAGVAVHATRLTAELRQTNQELRLSRTRLITAREEERRRLRRDLHDGLGSALTSMTFQLAAAQNQLGRDPAAVAALLGELKSQTQAAIADIRRLVYDLRPPALDELGLVSALREYVAHYQLDGLRVTLEASEALAPLPAAVELAAYRIALEALANVTRHAEARTCSIRLAADGGALVVEVEDDGRGLGPEHRAGVGITAMRERALELGGSCAVGPRSPGGVRVRAALPLGQA